jgi:hypothetical protein
MYLTYIYIYVLGFDGRREGRDETQAGNAKGQDQTQAANASRRGKTGTFTAEREEDTCVYIGEGKGGTQATWTKTKFTKNLSAPTT